MGHRPGIIPCPGALTIRRTPATAPHKNSEGVSFFDNNPVLTPAVEKSSTPGNACVRACRQNRRRLARRRDRRREWADAAEREWGPPPYGHRADVLLLHVLRVHRPDRE